MDAFASAILDRNIDIMWQARSRLDIDINDDLAIKLYNSGLREIRFGLESCNKRIWSLMNKFPESFSFSDVERTVDICSRNGIHVHFPMIVGFPSETMEERIAMSRSPPARNGSSRAIRMLVLLLVVQTRLS